MSTESSSPSCGFQMIVHARSHASRSPPRVLVAEDDAEMRRLVVDALRKDGYQVSEAADGGGLLIRVAAQRAAIANGDGGDGDALASPIDLVISDVRMPVCSGLEVLAEIRRSCWDVPVILMTAFGDDEAREHAASLGAILFDKPFSIDDLRTAVLNVLPIVRAR